MCITAQSTLRSFRQRRLGAVHKAHAIGSKGDHDEHAAGFQDGISARNTRMSIITGGKASVRTYIC